MSRMKKKKLKAKKESKRRVEYIQFTYRDKNGDPVSEKLRCEFPFNEEEKELNAKYGINTLGIKLEFFQEKVKDNKKNQKVMEQYEETVIDILCQLYDATQKATDEKVRNIVKKPIEWFDSLTLEEINALKQKVNFALMYVDVDELYAEIFFRMQNFFGATKSSKTFTGDEVAKKMTELELEWLGLKKNPKCLDTALRSARQQTAETAK